MIKKTLSGKTVKASKKAHVAKVKTPFRIVYMTVSKDGRGYVKGGDKNFKESDEAMAFAQGLVDKENDDLRQIEIIINPEA